MTFLIQMKCKLAITAAQIENLVGGVDFEKRNYFSCQLGNEACSRRVKLEEILSATAGQAIRTLEAESISPRRTSSPRHLIPRQPLQYGFSSGVIARESSKLRLGSGYVSAAPTSGGDRPLSSTCMCTHHFWLLGVFLTWN